MAGPLVAAETGGRAVEAVSKVLTGDLVVIRGQVFRTIRRRVPTGELTPTGRPQMVTQEVLIPVDVEAHVNPLSIGLGLAGLGVGLGALALGAWWAGIGVRVFTDKDREKIEAEIRAFEAIISANTKRIAELLAKFEQAKLTVKEDFNYSACKSACFQFRTIDLILNCLDECKAKAAASGDPASTILAEIDQLRLEITEFSARIKKLELRSRVPLKLEKRERMAPTLFRLF